jgi:hypothetical protein
MAKEQESGPELTAVEMNKERCVIVIGLEATMRM